MSTILSGIRAEMTNLEMLNSCAPSSSTTNQSIIQFSSKQRFSILVDSHNNNGSPCIQKQKRGFRVVRCSPMHLEQKEKYQIFFKRFVFNSSCISDHKSENMSASLLR